MFNKTESKLRAVGSVLRYRAAGENPPLGSQGNLVLTFSLTVFPIQPNTARVSGDIGFGCF